jgi:LPS-assembly protein
LFLPLLAGAAGAADRLALRSPEGAPLQIQADTLAAGDRGEKLEATGQVVIRWQGYRLLADRVVYDRSLALAEAEGDVLLEDQAGDVLRCAHLTLNVATQEGEARDASLWVAKEGYRVWGKRFVKTGPNSYRVEEGGFTACDGTWPSWRVEATRVDVELEGYLVGRGAAFWVEGAPVAYTPYILFPVAHERQSGFLLPKIGFSDRDGLLSVVRYYWAFTDNADATLRLEYRSRVGWTEGAELRYVLGEGHEGQLEATHVFDRTDDTHRYALKVDHKSRFPEGSRLRAVVDYQGDKRYLQDVGETLDERGVERLRSYLVATRDVGPGTVFGLAQYFEALTESQAGVLQTLPSVGLLGQETPLVGPLVWSPTVRATRFWRDDGDRGERWEFQPELGADLGLAGLGLFARAGYRQNVYDTGGATVSHGAAHTETGAGATWVRSYGSLLHTVEPSLRLSWDEAGRGGTTPVFDDQDVFANRSLLFWRVESRLLRAEDLAPVLQLDLERPYDLGHGEWAPWRGETAWFLGDKVSVRAEGEYDATVRDPWLRWSAGAEGTDRRGDRVFLDYRYLKGQAGYADGGLELPVTPELALQYRHRYSTRDRRTLEEGYAIHLSHPCWELLVSLSRNLRTDEDRYEHRYLAQMNLKGLGKLGSLRGLLP